MHRQGLDLPAARGFAFARTAFIDVLSSWPKDLMLTYWRDHQIIAGACPPKTQGQLRGVIFRQQEPRLLIDRAQVALKTGRIHNQLDHYRLEP